MLYRIRFLIQSVNFFKYLHLNYFCKAVKRCGKGKIIPYKNAVIDLEPGSCIILEDQDLQIGTNKLRGSQTETYLRLRAGATWNATEGCSISYGATLEILQNAVLTSDYFTMNSFSVIIVAENITLGHDVMIARNVVVYDSDFHAIDKSHPASSPVTIGDHVWIATNATVLKGVSIGNGAMIAANTLITENVIDGAMVAGKQECIVIKDNIHWRR